MYNQYVAALVHKTANALGKIFFDITVHNEVPEGPCIIAPRHYHAAYDPLVVASVLKEPIHFMVSAEMYSLNRYVNRVLDAIGSVPVRRNDTLYGPRLHNASDPEKIDSIEVPKKPLEIALQHLLHGRSMVIFPEGEAKIMATYEASLKKDFYEARPGCMVLAHRAKKMGISIPVIPVGITYEAQFDRKASMLEQLTSGLFSNVHVRFGNPIYIDGDIDTYTKILGDRIQMLS